MADDDSNSVSGHDHHLIEYSAIKVPATFFFFRPIPTNMVNAPNDTTELPLAGSLPTTANQGPAGTACHAIPFYVNISLDPAHVPYFLGRQVNGPPSILIAANVQPPGNVEPAVASVAPDDGQSHPNTVGGRNVDTCDTPPSGDVVVSGPTTTTTTITSVSAVAPMLAGGRSTTTSSSRGPSAQALPSITSFNAILKGQIPQFGDLSHGIIRCAISHTPPPSWTMESDGSIVWTPSSQ